MASVAFKQCELPKSLPRATAPTGNPQTCVLLIEDSEEAMFLVRIALQEHGRGIYRLEWAHGLTEGLERLTKGGVDLVLLDLGLPESSGPASYSWVREVAPETPVLVLTGDTREETEFAVSASGVEDYLIKDQVSGLLLIKAIRAALHMSERADKRRLKFATGPEESQGASARESSPKILSFVPAKPDCQN